VLHALWAVEFSRDINLAVSPNDLEAEQIYVPDLSADVPLKGHSCYFRCWKEDVRGLRIDIIGVMPFFKGALPTEKRLFVITPINL